MKFLQSFQKFIRAYHRLEVYGVENIPKEKSAVIAANHSGAWDIDTFILSTLFAPGRWIHILYAASYYYFPVWGRLIQAIKAIPLDLNKGLDKKLLMEEYFKKRKLVGIFPEGYTPSMWHGYRISKFYPGVIRLALWGKVPVIPTAIVGCVEAAPVLFNYRARPKMPADIFTLLPPLPLKIKIHFGKQVLFDKYYDKDLAKDNLYELADTVRTEIIKLLRLRGKNANDICKR